jgi:phosphoribosylaminoimidazole-succinocarboxamide synthase
MDRPLYTATLRGLAKLHSGKVRDIYVVDDRYLLIVTSDRLSAFDVVLPTPIPGKGTVLTRLSNFWFDRLRSVVPNHLADTAPEDVVNDEADREQIRDRAVVVRRLKPVLVEAVVRGYLIGSGWKDYRKTGTVCGIKLPKNLREADKLPEPIFTPSSKAAVGQHDENITFEEVARTLGGDLARQIRSVSMTLYRQAADYAAARGIIIADTKFEFGLDDSGKLIWIDEALTPDSSRFWPADTYKPGGSPPSFDKQYVRDYLESVGWNKKPPAPKLPAAVIAKTAEKYREALTRLTSDETAAHAAR